MEFSRKSFGDRAPRVNLRELKNELRKTYRAKRAALPSDEKAEMDAAICSRLASLISIRYADEILSFSPLAGEIDVTAFNLYALKNGKELYLPRCVKGTPEMNFHLVDSLDCLEAGSFSISEPSPDAPIWKNEQGKRAVCIIPAMSYDRNGYRLGYGKGYYDRHLSSKSALKIGVCYTDFLSDSIPRGRYDLAVDVIVTEKGIITVGKKG